MATQQGRLLVVCNDADYFLRHRLPVVESLAARGVDVHVLTGGRPIEAAEATGWRHSFMPVERFRFRPLADLRLLVKTFSLVLKERPDSVHLITLKPLVFAGPGAVAARVLSGRPVRILATLPGLGRLFASDGTAPSRGRATAQALTRRAIRFLAGRRGVSFSFETAQDRDRLAAEGLIERDRTFVMPGAGVDPKLFYPAPPSDRDGKVRFLFASRLLRSKGLDEFIAAAQRLSGGADAEFLIAGIPDTNDPDSVAPEELAALPGITFLGEIRDMPTLLRDCDVVCLPTRYGEGIPRILIEAAATGLVTIATDLGGCREIIEDGVTGRIIAAAPPASLSDRLVTAMRAYLEDPAMLRQQKADAYERFRVGGFEQDDIVARFSELLGFGR